MNTYFITPPKPPQKSAVTNEYKICIELFARNVLENFYSKTSKFVVQFAIMTTKTLSVKVHLYEVVEDEENSMEIADILNNINAQKQSKRFFNVNGYPMKMEELESLDGILLANFCKQRYVGPGKSSQDQLTIGFDLKDSESFGETTAALLTKDKKHVLVWYNHHGARATAIASYLTEWVSHGREQGYIEFKPVLRHNVRATIQRADSFGWVQAKFNLTNADIDSYRGPIRNIFKKIDTLFHIHKAANSLDESMKIECKITSQGKHGGISPSKGREYIDALLALHDENIVTFAKAEVRHGDANPESLNLLEARECRVCQIDTSGKRMVDFEDSKMILKQAYDHWKKKEMIETNDG